MHSDPEDEIPAEEQKQSPRLEIESYDDEPDKGFRAFVLFNTKLETLIEMWMRASQIQMDDDDQLVLQEMRHQIKLMLADHTHDKYLRAVSIMHTAALCGDEE